MEIFSLMSKLLLTLNLIRLINFNHLINTTLQIENTYQIKYLPDKIRLGQDKKQKIKPKSHFVHQDSIFSSQTNLAPNKKDSDRKFLKKVIRLGQNRKEENEWTHLPARAKFLEKNIHKKFVQGSNILQILQSDLSELKQNLLRQIPKIFYGQLKNIVEVIENGT